MSQNKIKLYQIDQSGATTGQVLAFNSGNSTWEPSTLAVLSSFADLANKPTTVSGYGITDAATLTGSEVLSNKIISSPTINSPTINQPKVKGEQAVTSSLGTITTGTTTVDLSTAQVFAATIAAASTVTFAFSNAPAAGQSQMIMLQLTNAGNSTIIWPAGTKFSSGVVPVLTVAGIDLLGVFYNNILDCYIVFLLGKDIK